MLFRDVHIVLHVWSGVVVDSVFISCGVVVVYCFAHIYSLLLLSVRVFAGRSVLVCVSHGWLCCLWFWLFRMALMFSCDTN